MYLEFEQSQQAVSKLMLFISFLLAFVLWLMPYGQWLLPFKPLFPLMLLIYWVLRHPYQIGIFTGFVLGLMVDVMLSSWLGTYALSFAIVAYVTFLLHLRMLALPLLSQMVGIALLLSLNQVIIYLIASFNVDHVTSLMGWFSVLVAVLIWPIWQLLMHFIHHKF